jgi:IS30 family transposase
MKPYRQITAEERYALSLLRQHGWSAAAIAGALGRHRSTIGREMRRNGTPRDGCYRPQLADWYARGRRSRSRRNRRFSAHEWDRIQALLREDWSPEQIAGRLRADRELAISHETIYRYIWADKHAGGILYQHLRGARKQRRKRYGRYDSRGRLAGKRAITERPASVATRHELGHWEGDTMLGASQAGPCVLSLVERKTGYLLLGPLRRRTSAFVNHRARQLIAGQPHPVRTITVDNGTEFHEYAQLERATGTAFYFATPHHAWERGTNENTNGLVRQYLPKRQSMAHLTQHECNRIATKLNRRPRKRLGFRTPEECYAG